MKGKSCILIVDDSELNRSILSEILEDYEILEAVNGEEAILKISEYEDKIDLILLDIVMPKVDGFEVLAKMNQTGWIKYIPVIMISSETSITHVEHAYDLGAVDYINRPFEPTVILKRIKNTLILFAKQRKLNNLVYEQMYKREKDNQLMVSILSHIVEFRNGESGLHVLHIRVITELLFNELIKNGNPYNITQEDIRLITNASALHDIGKIAIDDKILNKPGKLTNQEFEVVKTHSAIGAEMITSIPSSQDEKLVKYAYDICRWHHERWDGKGYPDGLKGDEIPIAAQIVALADVYDALTNERCYKKAYDHDIAIHMILNGECGQFNPILLELLSHIQGKLKEELKIRSVSGLTYQEIEYLTKTLTDDKDIIVSDRTVKKLEKERMKNNSYSIYSKEIKFDYEKSSNIINFSKWGAKLLSIKESILDPLNNEHLFKIFNKADILKIRKNIKEKKDKIILSSSINLHNNEMNCIIVLKLIYNNDDFSSCYGNVIELNQISNCLFDLKDIIKIETKLIHNPEKVYVLSYIKTNKCLNSNYIYTRLKDNEYLVFNDYKENDEIINNSHVYKQSIFPYDGFNFIDLYKNLFIQEEFHW